jgi:asparagine synthase (glutamine-hydrolysing)
MCGITGWQFEPGKEPSGSTLGLLSHAIRHRGPDDEGEYRDAATGVALAHRRLSIIDLSSASRQPMVNAETGVALVYNGELYNFRKLRAELQAAGHVFRTSGDTEVVLHAYLQWGMECLSRLSGMFALAIWDPRSGALHLARDAMGMKPLYYLEQGNGVVFASELKAFQCVDGFRAHADPIAVTQYLEFGYVFEGKRTMLAGVRKLDAGCRLRVTGGRVTESVAWFVPPSPDAKDLRDEAERVEELSALLDEVVAEHLVADVPLGMLLSGGLDSSLVASLASKKQPLLTLTMGFGNSEVDERRYAQEVGTFIGSRHSDVLIRPEQVKREVSEGAWVFDDLFADWGTISTRLLYRQCREQGIKVVVVGEGADELFGGYDIFNLPRRLGLWQQFRLYQKYVGRRHGHMFREFRSVIGGLMDICGGDAFHAVRLFESRRQLPNQYVMKVDKASMAEGVEARAPYLDRRIAELAYRTPREWLMRGGENKYLLRAVARHKGLLPAAISSRPKFGASLAFSWMDDDNSFRNFARGRLLDASSATRRLGLGDAMQAYFDGRSGYRFPAAISVFRNLAWRLLLLELWSDHYLAAKS